MIFAADIARILILLLWGIQFGFAGRVLYLYSKATASIPKTKRGGILLGHVMGVSTVYLVATAEVAFVTVARVGYPPTPLIPLNLALFGLGIYALRLVMTFERRRLRHPEDGMTVLRAPGETIVFDENRKGKQWLGKRPR